MNKSGGSLAKGARDVGRDRQRTVLYKPKSPSTIWYLELLMCVSFSLKVTLKHINIDKTLLQIIVSWYLQMGAPGS